MFDKASVIGHVMDGFNLKCKRWLESILVTKQASITANVTDGSN
jgi:hypothetical protein